MIILIIHIIVSYDYFIDFLCERWIPCQASTSVLSLHERPETVHYSTKDVYTSEMTFLALHPWSQGLYGAKICKGLQKSISELEGSNQSLRQGTRGVKSKPKALRHFQVNPVLKINETFYKQAESMWVVANRSKIIIYGWTNRQTEITA